VVTVIAIHPAALTFNDHRRQLGLDPSRLQLKVPEPFRQAGIVEHRVVEPGRGFNDGCQHATHHTEHTFDSQQVCQQQNGLYDV
jgi:hypothetical protein